MTEQTKQWWIGLGKELEKDIETLEDLIQLAVNNAKDEADKALAQEMSKLTGGLPLPSGMKLPF